jgi:WhiB family transcriptional regulator, redox-sensing transcriptional regulator
MTATPDSEWWRLGACLSAEPDMFFPISANAGADTRRAKLVCESCQVRRECLEYALRTRQQHGIWGGTTEDERRLLQNRARKAAARQRVSSAAS